MVSFETTIHCHQCSAQKKIQGTLKEGVDAREAVAAAAACFCWEHDFTHGTKHICPTCTTKLFGAQSASKVKLDNHLKRLAKLKEEEIGMDGAVGTIEEVNRDIENELHKTQAQLSNVTAMLDELIKVGENFVDKLETPNQDAALIGFAACLERGQGLVLQIREAEPTPDPA